MAQGCNLRPLIVAYPHLAPPLLPGGGWQASEAVALTGAGLAAAGQAPGGSRLLPQTHIPLLGRSDGAAAAYPDRRGARSSARHLVALHIAAGSGCVWTLTGVVLLN